MNDDTQQYTAVMIGGPADGEIITTKCTSIGVIFHKNEATIAFVNYPEALEKMNDVDIHVYRLIRFRGNKKVFNLLASQDLSNDDTFERILNGYTIGSHLMNIKEKKDNG